MGKIFEQIDEKLAAWIERQHLFFVATAPSEEGRINVSPRARSGRSGSSITTRSSTTTTSAAAPRRQPISVTTAASA